MQLHNLKPAQGSTHKKKRVGRGQASGQGTTAGRGNKGQQSRTGYSIKKGHEGGQMPLQRRVPKRGFKNIHRIPYKEFNIGQVDHLVEKYALQEFSLECLYINGLINRTDIVKVLGNGEIKAQIVFKVNAVSKKAQTAIEAAGGTIELIK